MASYLSNELLHERLHFDQARIMKLERCSYLIHTTINSRYYLRMCRRLMKQIERKFKNYVQNIENGTVYVQHDGASPHRTAAVEHEIQRIGLECTPRVIWIRQTPRSPEFNANDLAVYKHLGSTVEASDYRTSEELVGAVGLAWQAMPSKLLERVYACT